MVGTGPGFIRLSVYMDCTGKTISFEMQRAYLKRTRRVEVFSALRDKSFLLRTDVTAGRRRCIEMPNFLSETRLHNCTTQRLGGILEVVNTKNIFEDVSLLSELHRKLATMF